MGMVYESRISTIARSLNNFLRQFKVPEHLGEEAALQRIRMTAEAINRRFPASLHQNDLEARLTDLFVSVLENHKGREWPNVEAFASIAKRGKAAMPDAPADEDPTRGDKSKLSHDELALLDNKILPRARKWLGTSLDEHGRKTLEFWGEQV